MRTGSLVDGQWLVTEGLQPGQRVVVEGFQKFTVGDAVRTSAWKEAEAERLEKTAAAGASDQPRIR